MSLRSECRHLAATDSDPLTWPRRQDVGDFQNWAKTVEWDMKNIASALDYVSRSDSRTPAAVSYTPTAMAAAGGDFPVAAPADETPAAEAKIRKKP